MPKLIDFLDLYLFSDAPGLQARTALRRAWELATGSPWEDLYLASLDDALTEELPHLSAYSGRNTQRPTRGELAQVLAADLGDAANSLQFLEQGSRAFLTELARAMQAQRLITINRHNLFTDEYRQILLNLFDHAHVRFKSVLTRNEPEFSAALASTTGYDSILAESIETFLTRQFGVQLTTLALNRPITPSDAAPSSTDQATEIFSVEPSAPSTEPLSDEEATEIFQVIPPAPTEAPELSIAADEATAELSTLPNVSTEIETIVPDISDQTILQTQEPIIERDTEFDSFPMDSVPEMEPALPAPEIVEPITPAFVEPSPAPLITENPIPRAAPNRLRVLIATPSDLQTERRLLTELVRELDARSRARFGLELALVTPTPGEDVTQTSGQSAVELADIFIGAVWLQFGRTAYETDANGASFFAGTQTDFALALQQGSVRDEGWLRTVIYRSIRPPLDLLHLDVAEYGRVQQFFERASAYAGDDLIRVYADASELVNDARARLDAWIYNYAGDLAFALSEYARNSAASGQPAAALDDFDQAIALYRELDRPEQELALWLQVGELRQQTRQPNAPEAFDTALRLARRVENDQAAAYALRALGTLAASSGDHTRALEQYQQARAYSQPNDAMYRELLGDEIAAQVALGDAAQLRQDFATAADSYRAGLNLAQELGDSSHLANVWNKLGALASRTRNWNESITAYDNALAHWDTPRDNDLRHAAFDAQANAYAQIAETARAADDLQAAENAYQSALRANAQGTASRALRIEWFRALGTLAAARGDAARQIEAYDQALALLDSPQDAQARRALLAEQARAYETLGAARVQAQAWDSANSAYRDALALYQELDARAEQGATLYQLGSIALARGEWQEANAYLAQALMRLDSPESADLRGKALHAQASALTHIGDAHRDAQEWGQAEIAYVQARGNLEQLALSDETGALLYRLGVVTFSQSRLPESLAYFQQARARLDTDTHAELRAQSLRAESTALGRFAEMYRGAGDFQSAQAQYRQQLELAQELQDDALEADAFHSLGLVAADQNEWDNAVDLYEQALARPTIAAQTETRRFIQQHQLSAFEKIGERERAAHHLPQAELAYRSALATAEALGDRAREADLLYTLGLISIEHENWDEALVDLRRALGIYNLMPAAPLKPQAIWNIGRAQRGQKRAQLNTVLARAETARDSGAWLDAKPELETALQLTRDLADTRTEGIVLAELGDMAALQQDWDAAIEAYTTASPKLTAEDAERRTLLVRAQLDALRHRSIAKREAQQWSAADADLFVALDLARELNDAPAQGELVYQRGLVASGQTRWNEAIDLYSDALNRIDSSSTLRADIERAQADAYQALGTAEHDAQNWEGAEAAYTQALTLQQGLGSAHAQAILLAALGDVATRQARWGDAVAHLTRARELASADSLQTLDADLELATRALKREQQAEAERQGDLKRGARDFETARTEYSHALAFADELQDRAAQAELHAKLGFVATERADYQDALEQYRVAAGLYDAPESAPQRSALLELQAQTLQELGNRAGEAGQWENALQNYSQAIALLDAPAQTEQRNAVVQLQAVTLENLGDEARANQQWDAALDAYRRAAGLFALTNSSEHQRVVWAREADILSQLARDEHAAQQFELASRHYAEAAERLSDAQAFDALRQVRAAQLRVFRDSADVAADASDYNTARRSYRQALAIAEELDDRTAQAELYLRLGQLAARQRDSQSALLSYQYALERADAAPTVRDTILRAQLMAYQQLGSAQRRDGDFAAAEASYARAYANAQTLDDTPLTGELAFVLGMLSADQDAWESALGYYQRALAVMETSAPQRADVKSYQAYAFQQLGDTQCSNGQYDAAASSYASALTTAQEIQDQTRIGQILYRNGLLEAAQGRWEQALAAYQHAEAELRGAQDESINDLTRDAAFATRAIQRQQLAAQLEHAESARQAQQWDDAATSYRSAYALAETLDETTTRDALRQNLVNVYADKAAALRANEWWDEASDAYRESLLLAREFQLNDAVAKRERELVTLAAARANSSVAAADWSTAERAAQMQLALAQEFNHVDAEADARFTLGTIATKQEKWGDAKTFFETARPLFVKAERAGSLVELDAALAHTNEIVAQRAEMGAHLASAQAAQAQGQFDDAITAYRAALARAHTLNDSAAQQQISASVIAALAAKAHALHAEQDWSTAETTYRDALAAARESDNAPEVNARRADIVALATDKTRAVQATNNPVEIERAAQEQFAIAVEFEDAFAQADALTILGSVAVDRKELHEAKQYFERAHSLLTPDHATQRETIDAHLARVNDVLTRQAQLAETLTRAHNARALGDLDASLDAYRNALDLARGLDDDATASTIRGAIVDAAIEQARTQADADASILAYRTALDLAQEFGNDDAASAIRAAIVQTATEHARTQADADASILAYRTALDLAQEFGNDDAASAIRAAIIQTATEHARTQADASASIQAYRTALDLAQEFGNDVAVSSIRAAIVQTAIEQARTQADADASILAYRTALDLAQEFGNDDAASAIRAAIVQTATEHARTLIAQGDIERTTLQAAVRQQLAVAQEFEHLPAQAAAFTLLGDDAVTHIEWESAHDNYAHARELYVTLNDATALNEVDEKLARVMDVLDRQTRQVESFTLAQAAEQDAHFDDAISAYRTSLELTRGLQNADAATEIGNALVNVTHKKAVALQTEQSWDDAETAYREALAIAQEFKARHAQADAHYGLGVIHETKNDLNLARESFAQASNLYEQTEASQDLAVAQNALNRVERVLEQHARLANALSSAQTARTQGLYAQATTEYQSAFAVANTLGDVATQANIHVALASIAADQAQWHDALAQNATASELFATLDQPSTVAELANERARFTRQFQMAERDAARARGDQAAQAMQWTNATSEYMAALTLAQLLDDTHSQAESEYALAQIAKAEQRWTDASELYHTAAATFKRAQDNAQATASLEHELNAWTVLGENASAQQDWARARGSFTRAWLLAERLGQRATQGKLSTRLGEVAAQQHDLHSALKYFDRALEELDADATTEERFAILAQQAEIWQQLGDAEMDAANFAPAEEAYEQALELAVKIEDDAQRAEVLQSLGLTRGAQEKWDAARVAHADAYALVQDIDLPDAQLNILTALAAAEQRVGQIEPAREHLNLALPLAHALGETNSVAEIEMALARLATTQAHWQDALAHYEAARATYQQLQNVSTLQTIDAQQATAYQEFGDLMYGEGQWDAAQRAYERALELDLATARTDRDGELLYRLGRTATAQENYSEAIAYYDRAVTALNDEEESLRDRTLAQLAFALQQEGKRAQAAQEWTHAESILIRARKMAEASDNFDQVADLWFRLGNLYNAQALTDQAIHAYRQAYDFDRIDGNALQQREISNSLAQLLLNRTRAKIETQDAEEIETDLHDARQLAEQADHPQLLGFVLQATGDAAKLRGDTANAIDAYARAGHTFAAIEDTENWRIVSQQQATLLRATAAQELEAKEFADAENLYRRAWLLQQAAGDASHDAETHLGLGRALLAQQRYDDALNHFEQASALLETDAPERKPLREWYADALEASAAQDMANAQWDIAKFKFTRAAADRDELAQRARAGMNWQQLAEIATTQNALDDAIYANEQALARLDTPETLDARRSVLHQQAQILTAVGEAQQQNGELASASETYRHALNIAQEQGDLETLAQLYSQLASLAVARQEWEEANAAYHHALDVYQELDQPAAQAETWNKLGDMHRQAAHYSDASDAFEHARALYHAQNDFLNEGAAIEHLGHVAGDQENFDGALDHYQAALHLYTDINARGAKAQVYHAMERALQRAKWHEAQAAAAQGDAHLDAGEWTLAEKSYRDAMTLYAEAQEPALRAQAQNQLGVALEAQMRWDEALENYNAALTELERLEIPEAQVSVLANLGDTQRQRAKWNESETAYRQALALNEALNDAARAGTLYNSIGLAREAQGDWEGAIDSYQNAFALYSGAGLDAQEMQANLARAQRGAKQHAERAYKLALETARDEGDLARIGEALNTLGLLAAEDQRWDEALAYYREAVTTFEQLAADTDTESDTIWHTAQGTVLNNIGDTSLQIGAWRDAEYAYTRALGFAREIGDRESEAILLSQLGVAAQAQAQLPRALDLNLQALETYRALGEAIPRAELLERVGDLQLKLEQTAAAEATYQEALSAASANNDRERIARLWEQLGILAEARGANQEAIQYYREGLTRATELQHLQQQKTLFVRQGALYIRIGDLGQAERAQRAALELAIAQDDKELQAELRQALGQSAAASGDWDSALNELRAALALQETIGNRAQQAELHEQIGQAYSALGENELADKAYRAALEFAQDSSDINRAELWTHRAEIAARENRSSDAAEYYGNARAALGADAAPRVLIDLLYRRGDAALSAHDWNTADVSFNDALEIANASNERGLYGWGMNRLGVLAQAQREWDEALENYQEAIEILRVTEQPRGEAHVLNNIARLKLETNNAAEADLFGQAALAIAQALGSSQEIARSLYTRGLVALHAQELDAARRFLNQAIATDPAHWGAQLQLGNTLLASGTIPEAIQQAEAGLGQTPDWELGAQTQLTIAALYHEDTRTFKSNLKRTRALLQQGTTARRVSTELAWAVELVLRALEGNAETALEELNRADAQTALPSALDAQRFARTALLALSKSPRRFKGKPALVTYFTPPKPRTQKKQRRRTESTQQASKEQTMPTDAPTSASDEPTALSGDEERSAE